MSSQLLASCPKCGSTNVVRHISGELECLSCGYKWREGRRYGHPRTEEERRERHKERYGTEELPPRGRRFREEERDFYDAILGWCTYDRDSFYLTNELYGGYNYTCEKGTGAAQYVAPEKVLELAEKIGVEKIHLAGEAWKEIGHEGFGEEVSLEDAKRLLKELKEKRGGAKAEGQTVCKKDEVLIFEAKRDHLKRPTYFKGDYVYIIGKGTGYVVLRPLKYETWTGRWEPDYRAEEIAISTKQFEEDFVGVCLKKEKVLI